MHVVTLNHPAATALFHAHRASKPKGEEFFAAAKAEERLAVLVTPTRTEGGVAFVVDAPAEWPERIEDATFRYLEKALKDAAASDLFLGGGAPMVVAAMKALKTAVEEKTP